MNTIKRIFTLILAVLCLAGCLSGCKQETVMETDVLPTYSSGAMGRYVETSIPLPEGKYVQDMVMLDDGRLRVSLTREDGSGIVCTTGADRQTWEETWEVPAEILEDGSVSDLALSPDGTVFCPTWKKLDEESYEFHFWIINPNGTYHEIPITCPDVDPSLGYMVGGCDFTDSGKLMVEFQNAAICQVDLITGEVGENIMDQRVVMNLGCAGEDTYMAGWDSMSANLDGETGPLDNIMGQQLANSLKANEGNTPKFTYWRNDEGYLFFTTHEGLFSYIPGGAITEELVSGARCSMGDPKFLPVALTGGGDDTFYVLGSRASGENLLLHYAYDAQTPTVTDTHLRIYSLLQDEDLPQMVSQYQVAHPEVTVDLEIGITGENGVTLADAIRTLNTQILAGSGPDLICLDGFNLDTYREKGMLLDLTDTLNQAEPTLSQITRCYETDGQIFAVPTSFVIPAMYGPSHIVSHIHDWDSLIAAVEQLKAEKSSKMGVLAAFIPVDTANKFYDVYSSAWILPDGSISEEKLAEYYDGVRRVWNLDSEMQALWADRLDEEPYWPMGEFIGLLSSEGIARGDYLIGFGGLNGMMSWSNNLCARDEVPECETAALTLHDSGVFIPRGVMGILSGSQHPQAAADFLKFMLSEGVQAKDLTYSFPVNQAVFDKETSEDRIVESYLSSSDADGNHYTYQAQWPDARDRENLRAWVANLSIPASTDRTIRKLVLDQMYDCLTGAITPEEAAHAAMQSLNLYLAE